MKILVIPDSHAHPEFHNKRYTWLGKLVADTDPDIVLDIGDWEDMPSLCVYDIGKRSFEGKRYWKDVAAGIDARERFHAPLRDKKKKLPKRIALIGNHTERINKAISLDAAKLEGVISINDLQHKEYGWEVVPYNGSTPGIIDINGVSFSHYFVSGVMGRPISGERPAHQLVQKQYRSCVQGHIHTADHCVRGSVQGKKLHGLVCGVYQDYYADYAGVANDMWWHGVVMLHDVQNGQFDPEWINLERIKKAYA